MLVYQRVYSNNTPHLQWKTERVQAFLGRVAVGTPEMPIEIFSHPRTFHINFNKCRFPNSCQNERSFHFSRTIRLVSAFFHCNFHYIQRSHASAFGCMRDQCRTCSDQICNSQYLRHYKHPNGLIVTNNMIC